METIRRFAFEGPLTWGQAATLGVVLGALFAATLWLEARLTRKRWVLSFWLLRAGVLGTALWMLLEPTQILIERRTRPRSIAMVVDVSGSMQTVDPPNPREDLRWCMAALKDETTLTIPLADRAAVAAAAAESRLRQALQIAVRGGRSERLREKLESAERALDHLAAHSRGIVRRLDAGAGEVRTQAERLERTVTQDALPELKRLRSQTGTTGSMLPAARNASLQALVSRMEGVARLTRGLAAVLFERELAQSTAESANNPPRNAENRLEKVAATLTAAEDSWLGELTSTARVLRYTFDVGPRRSAAATWREALGMRDKSRDADAFVDPSGTNLASILEQIGRDAPAEMIEAVVLYSDGRHNESTGRDPREAAVALGDVPVYTVRIGDDRELRDIIVHHVDAPRAVAKDDAIVIESLVSTSDCKGESFQVELVSRDVPGADRVLERQELSVAASRTDHRVTFTTRGTELGRHEYLVRVAPVADEIAADNNAESVSVDVIENEIHVLFADNLPRWEFRYLSNLFRRDEHTKSDQLIFHPIPAGTGALQDQPGFPEDLEGWSRYRVVILGDLLPSQLSIRSQQALHQHVSQLGGALILIAGPEGMPQAFADQPLGEMLPVELARGNVTSAAGFGVVPTAEGRGASAVQVAGDAEASERVWRETYQFLPLQWLSDYHRAKPTSHTLLQAVSKTTGGSSPDDASAFLCWQTVGRGRVVYLSSPATYRLRARTGDKYHHAFWGQLLRWAISPELAAGSRTVRVSTDKKRYELKEPVQVVVQMSTLLGEPVRNAKVQAAAKRSEKTHATVDLAEDEQIPGRYVGRFERLDVGQFQIEPAGADVASLLRQEEFAGEINSTITVTPPLHEEMRDTRSDSALLAQIAEVTGGQPVLPTAVEQVARLAALEPHVSETQSRQPLWDTWGCLWLICGCLTAEWIIRKLTGLM